LTWADQCFLTKPKKCPKNQKWLVSISILSNRRSHKTFYGAKREKSRSKWKHTTAIPVQATIEDNNSTRWRETFETIYVGNKWVGSNRLAAIIVSTHSERLLEKGNRQTIDIEQRLVVTIED
jgi:hypothetical protein